jgi:hypothetical protein
MSCIQCGKEKKCHCQGLKNANQLASGGGGDKKSQFKGKFKKMKPIYQFDNFYGNCIDCGDHGMLNIQSNCEWCNLFKDRVPDIKVRRIPQRDISTINSIECLEESKGEVSWTKDGEELGVYLKRFIDENGASMGNKDLFFSLQFSKKIITEYWLFPPVAISPSIEFDSATAKVDSSATGKVGGSATGKVRGSVTAEPLGLLTTSNVVNLKIQPHCDTIYYYFDKKQVKIELGKIRDLNNFEDDGIFRCTTVFFTFEKSDTEFTRALLADFMKEYSYS